jgi:hypothetical protein
MVGWFIGVAMGEGLTGGRVAGLGVGAIATGTVGSFELHKELTGLQATWVTDKVPESRRIAAHF